MSNYFISMRYRPLFSLASRVRHHANELILAGLEQAGIHGIVPSHGDILVELFRRDGCSMGDLAEAIRRTKSTVTTLVKKLEAHGYVMRTKRLDDARGTLVHLTPKGRELEPVFASISLQLQRRIEAKLSDAEADQLEFLLKKLLGE